MHYILYMHGKWLSRSGKVVFEDKDDLYEFLRELFNDSMDMLEKIYPMEERKLLNNIKNSLTILSVSGLSKINHLYNETKCTKLNFERQKGIRNVVVGKNN